MSKRDKKTRGLVYSTDHGRMCPGCNQPADRCACPTTAAGPVGDGNVRVRRETAGRKGKGVTVVTGLPLIEAELAELGKVLKKMCGAGGTVKDGRIEIQGDRIDAIKAELSKRGFKVK